MGIFFFLCCGMFWWGMRVSAGCVACGLDCGEMGSMNEYC
ncbi:hypothetical protein KC19_4G043700 [Ceratodon purpureus]|uniref:Uncharacterized protein n=1 Tax=Ceratodon purpureus TaxID=3225 RepID=A0A8T0I5I2_CERPU|nr:hypothetical protein KC19_4G043700 [Ceratodon purpureus]